MKLHRTTLIMVASGVLFGLLLGILIQKVFPVGRTLQSIKQFAGLQKNPGVESAFVSVSPSAESRILALGEKMTIDSRVGAAAKLRDELRGRLESQLPEEERFRNSEPVIRILGELQMARNTKRVAEIEFRFDRVFREDELKSFVPSENSAISEEMRLAADRIAEFSRLLAENGTHLIYSPAPNPIDTFLPVLAGESAYHSARPHQTRFLLELLARDVDVIDLRPEFGRMALSGRPPFHRFDHHWTPAGNEFAAIIIQREIGLRFEISRPFASAGNPAVSHRWIPIPASGWNLNLAPAGTSPGTQFGREVLLDGARMLNVPTSPLWIMGDSILMEASINSAGVSADVGSHLSGKLEAPVNSLGSPGTVDIRPSYFLNTTLAGRKPKLLIWIHTDRNVRFPEIDPEALTAATEVVTGTANILDVSPIPNPKTTPYPDAIFSFRAELLLPREHTQTVIVYTWAFQNRSLAPLADIQREDQRVMTLEPWLKAVQFDPSLGKARLIDQLDNPEGAPVFWLNPNRIEFGQAYPLNRRHLKVSLPIAERSQF